MGQSAPLVPMTFVSPGVFGLNKQNSNSILPVQWATEAVNAVFDSSNRLSARKGWVSQTVTPIGGTPDIEQVFEYYNPTNGAKYIISAANNNLYSGVSSFTSIKGALTISANNWKFVNYNGKVYGLQSSHPLIEWNGSGNFTATTAGSGSVPNGNELLAAFGRLWGVSSDGQTLKYCGLLDATNWGSTGAGSINFTSVWPNGADTIVAVASFNAYLVVFGTRSILLIGDGSGSTLGLDPQNMYVADVISGVGCISRDTVQNINGDDLVFLSNSGVMSLRRVIEQQGNPLSDLTKNNRDYVNTAVQINGTANIRSTYNPFEGMYLLLLPTTGKLFFLSSKIALEDGSWRMTEWDGFIPKSLTTLADGVSTYGGKSGKIFLYSGKQDDSGAYTFKYHSPWILEDQQRQSILKSLKRISSIQAVTGQLTLIYKWFVDFKETFSSLTKTLNVNNTGGEFNSGEYNSAEYGGTYGLIECQVPAKKEGEFIKIGLETSINNADFSLNQMQVMAKFGRVG